MIKGEILEYPYYGTITKVIEGEGLGKDTSEVIYDGVMDLHMVESEIGRTLQTSSYIVSIPLVKDDNDIWIVPNKGDKISIMRYGENIELVVENATPSQLGGVSIYSSRQTW